MINPKQIFNESIIKDDNYFSSGVYFVTIYEYPINGHKRLVYIGSGKNMKKRVMNQRHPYRLLYNKLSNNYIVSCSFYSCDNYLEVEKECIKYFKPLLNKQHK